MGGTYADSARAVNVAPSEGVPFRPGTPFPRSRFVIPGTFLSASFRYARDDPRPVAGVEIAVAAKDPGHSSRQRLAGRDRQVARLIAQGRGNAEIADELGITLDVAKQHIAALRARTGAERREAIGDWYVAQADRSRRARVSVAIVAVAFVAAAFGTATLVDGGPRPVDLAATRATPFVPATSTTITATRTPPGPERFGPPDRFSITAADLAAMQLDRELIVSAFGGATALLVGYQGNGPVSVSPVGSARVRRVEGIVGEFRAFTPDASVLGRPEAYEGLYLVAATVIIYQNEAAAMAELDELRRRHIAGVTDYQLELQPRYARRVGPVIAVVEAGRTGFERVHFQSAQLVEILAERIRTVLHSLGVAGMEPPSS